MNTTHTDAPVLAYVVGAGPYPYRSQGLRMNRSEAIAYLEHTHQMRYREADQHLDLITAQAVRDAGRPTVERVSHTFGEEYRVAGSDPQPRREANRRLIDQWRLTPAEAASVLDQAPEGLH